MNVERLYSVSDGVPEYSYGNVWVICDARTKRMFDIGKQWAERQELKDDNQLLREGGIEPGAELEIVAIEHKVRVTSTFHYSAC